MKDTFTDIIFITKSSSGGAQTFVREFSNYLKLKKRKPLIIFGSQSKNADFSQWSNFNFINIPTLSNKISIISDFKSLYKIYLVLINNRSAKVITNSGKVSLLVRMCCFFLSREVIFIVHGWSYTGLLKSPSKLLFLIVEFIFELIDWSFCKKVFVSNYDKKNRPIRILNILKKRNFVIQNGAKDYSSIQINNASKKIKNTSITKRELRLLTVARLTAQKDIPSLLISLTYNSNVHLTIVGDGYQMQKLKKLAKKLQISQRVCFLGSLKPLYIFEQYRLCDIFILVSNWEGFPIASVEALSFSKPVIVSDVGGAAELFEAESKLYYGEKISKGNSPNEIAKLIRKFFDEKLLRTSSENARFVYEKHYKSENVYEQYFRILND